NVTGVQTCALPICLLLIIIVIGGIAAGVFTAVEGAAVAVLYTVILGLIYKELHLSDIPKILQETIIYSGMILLLIGASTAMSWILAYTGIPGAITNAMLSMTGNYILLHLIMIFILLVVCTFIDIV